LYLTQFIPGEVTIYCSVLEKIAGVTLVHEAEVEIRITISVSDP
jgi:hypothetical protein